MTTILVAGSVSVDPTTGVETLTAGLAVFLYQARVAIAKLPDPAHKRGCVSTALANPGDTVIQVDDTSGYAVGVRLGEVLFVTGTLPNQVTLKVTALTSTQVTFTPALPAGCSIVSGTKFGFEDTLAVWTAQTTPQLIKAKTSLADYANADAGAIVTQFLAHALVGRAVHAMPDSNDTVTAIEAAMPLLRTTGALTSPRTLSGFSLPASEDDTYTRRYMNDCTGAGTAVILSNGGGATLSVAVGARVTAIFSPAGVTLFN